MKRRADGTRYITRRPLKSRILKAREEQVNKERLGVSTDDDAASELKAGKFWSREERKRHLERAKERKQRHNRLQNEKGQATSVDKVRWNGPKTFLNKICFVENIFSFLIC